MTFEIYEFKDAIFKRTSKFRPIQYSYNIQVYGFERHRRCFGFSFIINKRPIITYTCNISYISDYIYLWVQNENDNLANRIKMFMKLYESEIIIT